MSSLLDRSRWRGLISDALPLACSATNTAREIFCILKEYILILKARMLCTASHVYCEDAMIRPIKITEPGEGGAFLVAPFHRCQRSNLRRNHRRECTAIRNGINSTMAIMMFNCR